jgi:DNA-binding SARP family transcriptional activator
VLGLLWPDRDERTARHLLADSLYVLRQTLGDRAIVAASETLRLSREEISVDVVEFRLALAEERWSDALALYRGDFLEGFHVRNAAEFDHWVMLERDRLRALAIRAASSLANALEKEGVTAEAGAAAERALDLDPCDETLFRTLIRLLVAAGNSARAETVARAFVERLASQLGASPSVETKQLLLETRTLRDSEPIVVIPQRDRRDRGSITDPVTAGIILQGRHHWQQRTPASVERAIAYFTRAIERDARAAEAWSGLADAWVVMGGRGYAPLATAIANGSAAANRALSLDDSLAAAHASIGGVNILRRRWHEAETALRHAIRLDPKNADAHNWLSLTLLTGFGARGKAIREQTIGATLNPVSSIQAGALGWQRYLNGEYELSRSNTQLAFDLNSDFEEGQAGLARVAARLGDEATVKTVINAGLMRRRDLRGDLLAEAASAFAVLGDKREAGRLAVEATEYEGTPANFALAWSSIGEADKAFAQLARESFDAYWTPHAIWWDPRFDDIREDARFAAVEERAARAWSPEWK